MTADCSKCGGKGWIPGFERINNGICFRCRGSGRQSIRRSPAPAVKPLDARRAEWVLGSTCSSYSGLSWQKMESIRSWVYGAGPQITQEYPGLLDHYQEVGEPLYFVEQESRHQEWLSEFAWR